MEHGNSGGYRGLLASGGTGQSGHLRVGYGPGIDIWDTFTGQKVGALTTSPQCAAFSPNGTHLATGGRDHSIVIWDVPKIAASNKAQAPSIKQRDAWWAALGGQAKDAYKAMGEMIDAPEPAVGLLKERVQPVQRSNPNAVAKLIVQLDSDAFAERVKAQTALESFGEGAAHLLTKALEGNARLESRRRLEALLSKCEATSERSILHHRVAATLEWIGTPGACELLRSFATGAPRARLTTEAEAALKRLNH